MLKVKKFPAFPRNTDWCLAYKSHLTFVNILSER